MLQACIHFRAWVEALSVWEIPLYLQLIPSVLLNRHLCSRSRFDQLRLLLLYQIDAPCFLFFVLPHLFSSGTSYCFDPESIWINLLLIASLAFLRPVGSGNEAFTFPPHGKLLWFKNYYLACKKYKMYSLLRVYVLHWNQVWF